MPMVFIVVVLKLFLMGIAGTVPLARVVSCLGVGGLLLLVGWFAPMPGKRHSDWSTHTGGSG
ncbi:DUF2339 domain-containing protein [Halomonadaceae bacterium KBTZ08]